MIVRIAVGSQNPAKVKAVQNVFQKADVIPLSVQSGVSEQPFSDDETIMGAINRAKNCLSHSDVDFGIGLEGGVVQTKQGLFVCNWGALATHSHIWIAGGARILLPEVIAKRLLNGEELGPVMDDFTHKANIRKSEGAIGVFTNDRISRTDMFEHIMKMLLGQYEYHEKSLVK